LPGRFIKIKYLEQALCGRLLTKQSIACSFAQADGEKGHVSANMRDTPQ
jgi:hypothetical protein